MNTKFFEIDPIKQRKIVNAAMREFAHKGYKKASTNEIVKDSGISKGLLFHYFRNKKELYLYLFDRAVEIANEEFYAGIKFTETDVIKIWRKMALLKFNLMRQFPEIINFIMSAYFEEAEEVVVELQGRKEHFNPAKVNDLFINIDASKFREDLEVDKVLQVITWTMEGVIEQERNKAKDLPIENYNLDETIEKIDHCLDVLKDCFYK
ncbi:TetR/AcrR family transcriptional regulator [Anaerobacillus alkaliphilus]|uniref:TetR/AcrR family transcriptional regulator n=1 Tax=Anaerobacillus alkaliphilus TaxID=1548597 RepID=A0A4Q0VPT0_9BACI|nr:TetR/AcrR family transcriptional regulator [Anaerobacillus alkaliphilus]RXI96345.1 TetR/AcrR family transcriptional regulator [Anaerobacillus alkaliphilus]